MVHCQANSNMPTLQLKGCLHVPGAAPLATSLTPALLLSCPIPRGLHLVTHCFSFLRVVVSASMWVSMWFQTKGKNESA